MPTYEYVCNECEHEFEVFQSITAPVKRKCPKCKTLSLERLIGTGAGVIFKGSGFYETDYRSDSYKKAAEAETKKGSTDGGKEKNRKSDAGSDSSSSSDKSAAPKGEKKTDSASGPKNSSSSK